MGLPFYIVISQKSVFGEMLKVEKARNSKGFQPFLKTSQKAKSFLGGFLRLRLCFWEIFGELGKDGFTMRKSNYKGRCEKRNLSKCKGVCKTYDLIQSAYADMLQADTDIIEFSCNVLLEGSEYMTDFVCVRANQEISVRECVNRNYLTKPMTVKLLDFSKEYWQKRGVSDWGVVINED